MKQESSVPVVYDLALEKRAKAVPTKNYVPVPVYRYLGIDGRVHEVEEGQRVEVLPVGYEPKAVGT